MIELNDVSNADASLKCTQADVDSANDYLIRKASKLGITREEIQEPLSGTVTRLGVAYACYTCALRTVGRDPINRVSGGSSSDDIYNLKRKTYLDEIKRLETDLSADDFAPGIEKEGSGMISLSRA